MNFKLIILLSFLSLVLISCSKECELVNVPFIDKEPYTEYVCSDEKAEFNYTLIGDGPVKMKFCNLENESIKLSFTVCKPDCAEKQASVFIHPNSCTNPETEGYIAGFPDEITLIDFEVPFLNCTAVVRYENVSKVKLIEKCH
jgi:hypothetical protein